MYIKQDNMFGVNKENGILTWILKFHGIKYTRILIDIIYFYDPVLQNKKKSARNEFFTFREKYSQKSLDENNGYYIKKKVIIFHSCRRPRFGYYRLKICTAFTNLTIWYVFYNNIEKPICVV